MILFSEHSTHNPKRWFWVTSTIALLLIILVAAPTIYPNKISFLNQVKIDTDPENMLSTEAEVRLFHNEMKKEYNLNDIIVVGIVNDSNPKGVFTPTTLANIYKLTEKAKTIKIGGGDEGVISSDIISPSTVDNIEQAGIGTVRFEWLMKTPPKTQEEADKVALDSTRIPFLNNTLISQDGKALALYIPITSKNISYKVASKIKAITQNFTNDPNTKYYITGLPIAQDQFGVEMFKQMAISAPIAMGLIFALMWAFFRNIKLIIAPMIVAIISVIFTMCLLIITGNTVHIMSSMIPIFIMPIAVLDAVHIISDFFDKYQRTKDRYKTIKGVMEELNKPMLFTSLTTCAGFASLALTPIPPVQVFGIFISLGVFFAWLLTITLIPAYIMLMSESSLKDFGIRMSQEGGHVSPLGKLLQKLGKFTYNYSKLILVGTTLLIIVAVYGITKIQINDNPVKWFEKNHEIRIADKKLNEKFAGTYMAYLTLSPKNEPKISINADDYSSYSKKIQDSIKQKLSELGNSNDIAKKLKDFAYLQQEDSSTDEDWDEWENFQISLDKKLQKTQIFKDPATLNFIGKLQNYLITTGLVGKSNSLPDIVKTVHRELLLGKQDEYKIPNSSSAVAQTLMTYQSSHRPQDLWHFVTPDYQNTNLWIQLKSGDNKDMKKLVEKVNKFFTDNQAPIALEHKWFGLTYINVVWQEKMVAGMAKAFAGSFVTVLIMMIFLFRSFWWGVLSMIPLVVTIAIIYGIIGIIGKDYDMPVAVLSSLSLGLAIDYAIHFIARTREIRKRNHNWKNALGEVFGDPARAISRNVIVIGIGFLPLLAAPLIPYQTVGTFISAILLFAGFASLIILPALINVFRKKLF